MGWHSFRFRLTLWNVAILALVLGGFGAALCYAVQASQVSSIDADLTKKSDGLLAALRSPRGRSLATGTQSGLAGILPDGTWLDEPLRAQRTAEAAADARQGNRGGGWPFEAASRRAHDFGHPMLFDLQGRSNPDPRFLQERPWYLPGLRAAAAGRPTFSSVVVEGEPVRVYSTPLLWQGKPIGVLQTANSLSEHQRLVQGQVQTLLVLVPLALLVAGLGGLFLTNRALRPVYDVTRAAEQIGDEDLSLRLPVRGQDELALLATTFNGMISRLQGTFHRLEETSREKEAAHQELREAYRKLEGAYEEQRRFAGDASHELRTPLTMIKGYTSIALSGAHDADRYRMALERADKAADAMGRIVSDLLLLARADVDQLPLRPATLRVAELLRKVSASVPHPSGAEVRVEVQPEPMTVEGDADHLTRLFTNLLENALRHTPTGGEVILAARAEAGQVSVTVTDTGEGIPSEHLPHVFKRFYRVDASRGSTRGGTGLGLAICQSIVQAHGGTISIRSEPGQGTTVQVTLPTAMSPSGPPGAHAAGANGNHPRSASLPAADGTTHTDPSPTSAGFSPVLS